MTPKPECVGLDTTLVDALHTMHDGKFLHLPVVNQDGGIVACVDVLQLTHGAVATVGSSESGEMASNMLQKFWDSALALEPPETDDDSHRFCFFFRLSSQDHA
jgi:CBS domain-containing protein